MDQLTKQAIDEKMQRAKDYIGKVHWKPVHRIGSEKADAEAIKRNEHVADAVRRVINSWGVSR